MNRAIARKRLGLLGQIILGTLATAGIIILFAGAPGLAHIFKLFEKKNLKTDRRRINQVVQRLKQRKLIETELLPNGNLKLIITTNGTELLKDYAIKNLKIPTPTKWDNKWRLVCFDIPEGRSDARYALRRKLYDLGFIQIQKSVFALPHPCDKEIMTLAKYMLVENHVKLFTAEHSKHLESIKSAFFKNY